MENHDNIKIDTRVYKFHKCLFEFFLNYSVFI